MQRTDEMQRMDFETLVQTRKSVRGFTNEPVARTVIEDIIEVAKRAPSSMNTQPWHIHVLTGEPLEELRRRNMEEMTAGAKPKRDIVSHGEYQGVHRGRQVDIAKKLFAVMGIARDDKPMRQDWVLRGFRQFDAPVSLVLTYDKILDPGAVCHSISARCAMASCSPHGTAGLAASSTGRASCARTSCARSPISPRTRSS
jgi:nitroreductase